MTKILLDRLFKKYTYSFEVAADAVSQVVAINPTLGIKGEVVKLVVTVPDWVNTVTTTVIMNNSNSKELYRSFSFAKNEEYDITLCRNECIIMGLTGEEWKVELSGVPGGVGGVVTLSVYAED